MKINLFLVIMVIISLVIGYIAGYYFGKQDGKKKGILLTPILLRKTSFEKGYCILCENDKNSQDLQGNKDKM
jgi:hypothetical protein